MNAICLLQKQTSFFCIAHAGTGSTAAAYVLPRNHFFNNNFLSNAITACVSIIMLVAVSTSAFAQNSTATDADKQLAYTKTINDRAQKIVAGLAITDEVKAKRVAGVIAGQYSKLNDIHTSRDAQIKALKAQGGADKALMNDQVKKLEDEANLKMDALHKTYLATLSEELIPKQVDQVKDGMTYDVVHVTYNGYTNMILNLTEAQKKQIMDWLVEAREHAMDAESSDKKHAWFGKYKGRINNYLSSAGYDLNKVGKEWEKRRNAEKAAAKN